MINHIQDEIDNNNTKEKDLLDKLTELNITENEYKIIKNKKKAKMKYLIKKVYM